MEKDYYISDDEIARRLGIEKKAVAQLIKKHREIIEEFGNIITERVPSETGDKLYRLLTTQEQYLLLMLLVKNTEKSLKLKVEIVREIFNKNNEE